jgi:hypothetical protein
MSSLRKTIYESAKECKAAATYACPLRLDKTRKNLKKAEQRKCEKGQMGISRLTKRRLCSYITTNPTYTFEKKVLKKDWVEPAKSIKEAVQLFFTPMEVEEYKGGFISDYARILYLLKYMKGNVDLFLVKGDINASKLLWTNLDPDTDEITPDMNLYIDESLSTFLRKSRKKQYVFANLRMYLKHQKEVQGDEGSSVHANFLAFDIKHKLIYRYEPSGIGALYDVFDMDDLDLAFHKWAREHKWKYVAPWESCPRQAIGKIAQNQRLAFNKKKTNMDPGGFCKVWSLFMLEQKMRNPSLSLQELHDQSVAYFKQTNADMLDFARYFTTRVNTTANNILRQHGYTPDKGTPDEYLEEHWNSILNLAS